jgi:hypothetical protein
LITITNTGDVPVNSLTVSDTVHGNIASHFTVPLAPGASTTYLIGQETLCAPTTKDTVTVTPWTGATAGTGVSGSTVTSSATATVIPMGLACQIQLCLSEGCQDESFDLDGKLDNHITLSSDTPPNTPIRVTLTLKNTGQADLTVTQVSGLPDLVDCDTGLPVSVDGVLQLPTPGISIKAGQSSQATFLGCWLVTCAGGTAGNFTVGAHAVADSDNATECLLNSAGQPVSTDILENDRCPASVDCVAPASCRVTGGGVLIPGETEDGACSPTPEGQNWSITTATDGPLCNQAKAVKITHGGQLGAPYANESCGNVALFPMGDPCIRGQWEHVRHYQGKANPKSTVSVDNFHSNTPKGIFDMVKCACLPCCENPGAGGDTGKLCNPADHKICGPMPRPAPANAIIFTGVGYMSSCATANAKGKGKLEAVVFRVYIEDRSEPGGQHPGGAKKPADVYCFQAWSLSSIPGNTSGKLDSAEAIAARQALATDSCNYLENYTQGVLPNSTLLGTPVVNDCGALHTGNQQIHPSTSATCPNGVPVQ